MIMHSFILIVSLSYVDCHKNYPQRTFAIKACKQEWAVLIEITNAYMYLVNPLDCQVNHGKSLSKNQFSVAVWHMYMFYNCLNILRTTSSQRSQGRRYDVEIWLKIGWYLDNAIPTLFWRRCTNVVSTLASKHRHNVHWWSNGWWQWRRQLDKWGGHIHIFVFYTINFFWNRFDFKRN